MVIFPRPAGLDEDIVTFPKPADLAGEVPCLVSFEGMAFLQPPFVSMFCVPWSFSNAAI
jgi:hypothetical protein